MKKFDYNGTKFKVLDSYDTEGHETWQMGEAVKSDRTIVKTIFPILPIWIKGKFKWFKKCKVRYRLYFTRTKQFDDGWTYAEYWTPWKHRFEIEEIID